jgi:arylformamidase
MKTVKEMWPFALKSAKNFGADYLSVGCFRADGVETHQALLKAGIWIIEGLNLKRVRPGRLQPLCLPLEIAGGDGAPARALVRSRDRFGRKRR